jgi:hypothetical protein
MAQGWGQFGGQSSFRAGVDRSVGHGGTSSGHLTARSGAPEGFGTLSQIIRADDFRGKRVRFSAYVKTRGVSAAGLWMRVDGNGGILAFDNMGNRVIGGTNDWTLVSVVLDVPKEAAGIALGVLLLSAGEVWIDDASLEVVGTDVRDTNMMAPTSNAANVDQQRAMYASAPLTLVNVGFEAPQ